MTVASRAVLEYGAEELVCPCHATPHCHKRAQANQACPRDELAARCYTHPSVPRGSRQQLYKASRVSTDTTRLHVMHGPSIDLVHHQCVVFSSAGRNSRSAMRQDDKENAFTASQIPATAPHKRAYEGPRPKCRAERVPLQMRSMNCGPAQASVSAWLNESPLGV